MITEGIDSASQSSAPQNIPGMCSMRKSHCSIHALLLCHQRDYVTLGEGQKDHPQIDNTMLKRLEMLQPMEENRRLNR